MRVLLVAVIVHLMASASNAYEVLLDEGFESNFDEAGWVASNEIGVFGADSNYVRSGESSLRLVDNGDGLLLGYDLSQSAAGYTLVAWFYDDLDAGSDAAIRVSESGEYLPTSTAHLVAGVDCTLSSDNYVVSEGAHSGAVTALGPARTEGWHWVRIVNDGATNRIYIDGEFVHSTAFQVNWRYVMASTRDDECGDRNSWFDDFRVCRDAEPPNVSFVDIDAVGAGDGSSWANAFPDLQSALHAAITGDEVWIAEGTYTPTQTSDRSASFVVPAGVALRGGFSGFETSPEERTLDQLRTILSGEIGDSATREDNSVQMVRIIGADSPVEVEWLAIEGSYSSSGDYPILRRASPGMHVEASTVRLRDVTIRDCYSDPNGLSVGGGIGASEGSILDVRRVTVANCVSSAGGGIAVLQSELLLEDAHIVDCDGGDWGNGGILTFDARFSEGDPQGSQVVVRRALIEGSRGGQGGAITGYDVVVEDSIFRNTSGSTGAAYGSGSFSNVLFDSNYGGQVQAFWGAGSLTNCVFTGHSVQSIVSGGATVSAVVATSQSLTLEGCTFAGNGIGTAGPSGIANMAVLAVTGGVAQVSNTIFWGNPMFDDPDPEWVLRQSLYVTGGSARVESSILEGVGAWDSTYGVDGGGNLFVDPLYASPTNADFRLQPGSPAINAGDARLTTVAVDFDGNPRIAGPSPDIGAFEFQGPVPGPRADFILGATSIPGSAASVSWARIAPDSAYRAYLTRRDIANVLIEPLPEGGVSTSTPATLADGGSATAALWTDNVTPGYPEPFILRRTDPGLLILQLPEQGFVQIPPNSVSSTSSNRAAVALDYNSDGALDLFLGRVDGQTDLLFESGAGPDGWLNVTPPALAQPYDTAGIAPGDYDNDGDTDLYLVYFNGPNALVRNNGDGTWTDVTPPLLADPYAGLSAAWGDYDNDGLLDLFLANSDDVNRIYKNDGGGNFSSATPAQILTDYAFSENASWVDVDNDGLLDLFYTRRNLTDRLWRNTGDGFEEVVDAELAVIGNHTGAAWADFDEDGDLDLFLAEYESDTESRLLVNELPAGNSWAEIDLVGFASNYQGIGARLRVVAGGVTQIRDVTCSAGNRSQNMTTVHFGLGSAATIDSMTVRWPSGLVQTSTNLPVNQLFTIPEGGSFTDAPSVPDARLALDVAPNPFNPVTTIRYTAPAGQQLRVAVYDLRGREVDVVYAGIGTGEDRVVTWAPENAASGVYFVRLEGGDDVITRKVTLVK